MIRPICRLALQCYSAGGPFAIDLDTYSVLEKVDLLSFKIAPLDLGHTFDRSYLGEPVIIERGEGTRGKFLGVLISRAICGLRVT